MRNEVKTMKQVSVSQQMPRGVTSATLAFGAIALLGAAMMPQISAAASVTPIVVSGNPSCKDLIDPATELPYVNGFKLPDEPPPSGESTTYTYPGSSYSVTVTIDSNGVYFDWTSEIDVDAVIVKGSNSANVYVYSPAAALGDTVLNPPVNASGDPAAISHIEFCYTDLVPPQASLTVIKTAATTFDRAWSWEIDKIANQTELTLMPGQEFTVNYSVDVDATSTDSNWAVSGLITIDNIGTIPANIASVTDVVSEGIAADVDCGVTFPYSLPADDSLECTYSTSLPDASSRVNTATVTATNAAEPFTAAADVLFSETPTNESDECIDVTDTNVPPLGRVCADDAPRVFNYPLTFGTDEGADVVLECGDNMQINTAAFLTIDTQTPGSDDWTVTANVVCEFGCTLTQGYWKTHSEFGKAPYDDNWANLQSGASTPFFLSGQTYYQVFWTPPAGGNVYYILAHQWIAAELNVLNGASIPADVLAAWTDAKVKFFAVYTPKQAAGLKGAAKSKWQGIASLLDGYNNGLTGPGHCSEDSSSE